MFAKAMRDEVQAPIIVSRLVLQKLNSMKLPEGVLPAMQKRVWYPIRGYRNNDSLYMLSLPWPGTPVFNESKEAFEALEQKWLEDFDLRSFRDSAAYIVSQDVESFTWRYVKSGDGCGRFRTAVAPIDKYASSDMHYIESIFRSRGLYRDIVPFNRFDPLGKQKKCLTEFGRWSQKAPQWTFCIVGHGDGDEGIVGIDTYDFMRFLKNLDERLSVRMVYILSCYGVGAVVNRLKREDGGKTRLSYPLIMAGVTNCSVSASPLADRANGSQFGEFTKCVERANLLIENKEAEDKENQSGHQRNNFFSYDECLSYLLSIKNLPADQIQRNNYPQILYPGARDFRVMFRHKSIYGRRAPLEDKASVIKMHNFVEKKSELAGEAGSSRYSPLTYIVVPSSYVPETIDLSNCDPDKTMLVFPACNKNYALKHLILPRGGRGDRALLTHCYWSEKDRLWEEQYTNGCTIYIETLQNYGSFFDTFKHVTLKGTIDTRGSDGVRVTLTYPNPETQGECCVIRGFCKNIARESSAEHMDTWNEAFARLQQMGEGEQAAIARFVQPLHAFITQHKQKVAAISKPKKISISKGHTTETKQDPQPALRLSPIVTRASSPLGALPLSTAFTGALRSLVKPRDAAASTAMSCLFAGLTYCAMRKNAYWRWGCVAAGALPWVSKCAIRTKRRYQGHC